MRIQNAGLYAFFEFRGEYLFKDKIKSKGFHPYKLFYG